MFKFLAGWLSKKDDDMETMVRQAIADEHVCVVLRLVQENPGIPADKLTARAGISQDIALPCLEKLAEAGLIEKGADAGYSVTDRAKNAVIKFLPLNYQCPGLLR